MNKKSPGKRIQAVRDYFGLTQGDLCKEIGISQPTVSSMESDKRDVSNALLYGLMVHYAVNPEWILSGEGEMLTAPEEYLANGIKRLGAQRFSEGLVKVLIDPEFAAVQAYMRVGELAQGSLDRELEAYLKYILDTWHQGDEKLRNWLMVQLQMAFREAAERLKER